MERPTVDVVVPVAAADAVALRATLARLRASLVLRPGDTLTVVDNRDLGVIHADVLVAPEVRTSYYARNQGAARGTAEWLLFLDADVTPEPGLLDALFEPPPAPSVGVLAGAIADAPPSPAAGVAGRFAALKGAMSQEIVLAHGRWAFAQTANAAVRRSAFTAVGGFVDDVRSGGDADLCWRLRAAGWSLEPRPRAAVAHANRARVGGLLAQRFRHGTGAGWLAARWPGALPARRWPGLLRWGLVRALAGTRALARGDRDAAVLGLLDGPAVWAFELGRLVPNRPLRRWRESRAPRPAHREGADPGALPPLPPHRRAQR